LLCVEISWRGPSSVSFGPPSWEGKAPSVRGLGDDGVKPGMKPTGSALLTPRQRTPLPRPPRAAAQGPARGCRSPSLRSSGPVASATLPYFYLFRAFRTPTCFPPGFSSRQKGLREPARAQPKRGAEKGWGGEERGKPNNPGRKRKWRG
jgi:hypothetical protein